MSDSKSAYRYHFSRIAVLLAILAMTIRNGDAQDTPQNPKPEPPTNGRIVEGRPALYFFKRDLHPFTWFEWASQPVFRSADTGLIHRLAVHRPPPPKQAGVRFSIDGAGAGSSFGPEVTFFNKNLLGRGIDVEIPLLYTVLRYEFYRFQASVPLARETPIKRLSFDVGASYSSRPKDDMFPLGNESPLRLESIVRTVGRASTLGFSGRIDDHWRAGLHESYLNIGVTKPYWGISAQGRFRGFDIPGLYTGGAIRSTIITVDHNTQNQNLMPARGGLQHLEVSVNDSTGKGNFGYWKYHLDFQHFFPFTNDNRTMIALRGFAEANSKKAGRDVPWFDMPVLGTWETLRGFEDFRFRDRSALAFAAEYRYRIWRALDWAFFLDEGQVAPRPGDFGWDRFHAGYGVRLFAYPKMTLPIAIDAAHSAEGWHFYINFNTTF